MGKPWIHLCVHVGRLNPGCSKQRIYPIIHKKIKSAVKAKWGPTWCIVEQMKQPVVMYWLFTVCACDFPKGTTATKMFVCNGWDAFEKRLERFLKQMSGRQGRGSVSALSEGYFPLGLHSSGPSVYVCSKSKARLILSERIPRSFACFCSLVAINPSNWDDPLRWAGGAHFWIISPPRHASHWARTAREGRDAELKHSPVAKTRVRTILVLSRSPPRCYSRASAPL